jgi:hypothetical protein
MEKDIEIAAFIFMSAVTALYLAASQAPRIGKRQKDNGEKKALKDEIVIQCMIYPETEVLTFVPEKIYDSMAKEGLDMTYIFPEASENG